VLPMQMIHTSFQSSKAFGIILFCDVGGSRSGAGVEHSINGCSWLRGQ
jgi:hypothetical protein